LSADVKRPSSRFRIFNATVVRTLMFAGEVLRQHERGAPGVLNVTEAERFCLFQRDGIECSAVLVWRCQLMVRRRRRFGQAFDDYR
jgi:hypothetical protein